MLTALEGRCIQVKICVVGKSRKEEFAAEGVEQPSAQQATDSKGEASLDFIKPAVETKRRSSNAEKLQPDNSWQYLFFLPPPSLD